MPNDARGTAPHSQGKRPNLPQGKRSNRPQGNRPNPPQRDYPLPLKILGTIVAVFVAIGSAIGGFFSRLFGGGRNRQIFASRNHMGGIRRGGGHVSTYRGGRSWSRGYQGSTLRLSVVLKTALAGAGALTLLSTVFFVSNAGMGASAETPLLNMQTETAAQVPLSTPREQWSKGSLPYLYQTDPAWSAKPYGGGTVALNGCGPTCLTMVYIYLTGNTDINPADMCAFADENNFAPTGATERAFMTDGAAMLGITGHNLSVTSSEVASILAAGEPVICVVRPGDFTSVGHFIVLYGIDDNNMVNIHDPNSSYVSAQKWDLNLVLSQTNACWSFSA